MPALGAGIHVWFLCANDVDGRDKPGHDDNHDLSRGGSQNDIPIAASTFRPACFCSSVSSLISG